MDLKKFKNPSPRIKIIQKIYNSLMNKNENKSETNLTLRYYGLGAQIIKDFKIKNMILLSRTRKKIIGLEGFGLKNKKQVIIKWKKY